MLPASAVFDQAHNEAIALFCVDYHGRNFTLAELNECFDTALTAHKIVFKFVNIRESRADRNGSFQADLRNTFYDLVEISSGF